MDLKDFAESLKRDLQCCQDILQNFITKIEKFDDSVDEWNLFLAQAHVELETCQKNPKRFEDLEENLERLQV